MKKILVVDDDPAILEVIKVILEDSNYHVKTSESGSVLLNLNGKRHPDLILLDVLLSGEDGRDIARALKTKKSTKDIPIIMISASPSTYEGALAAGADDFISKPFDIDHLLKVIHKNLKGV
jgi:DNA-binding response OmpR family regulator